MIEIVEKPDWVSWDEVADVVHAAHAENRKKGILMRYAQMSGDEMRQRIENQGVMLVAMDDKRVVGTMGMKSKMLPNPCWYGTGEVAYTCFGAILPEYMGKGVFRQISKKSEQIVRQWGLNRIMFDTNAANKHLIKINQKAGYKLVKYKYNYGHASVVAIKWLDGCPYPDWKVNYQYIKSKYKTKWELLKQRIFHKSTDAENI